MPEKDRDLRELLRQALELGMLSRRINPNLAIALYLIQKRQLDSAELTLDMALVNASGNKPEQLIPLLLGKADLAIARDDLEKAGKYVGRASALAEAPDPAILNKEAEIAARRRDWELALEKHLEAAEIYRSKSDQNGEGEALLSAAQAAFKLLRFEEALGHLRTAWERGSDGTTLRLRARLGELSALTALKRHNEALDLCGRVEAEIKDYPFPQQAIESLLAIVDAKREANLSGKGMLAEAHAIQTNRHEYAPTAHQKAILSAELALAEFIRGRPDRAKEYEEQALFFSQGVDGIPEMLLSLSRLNLIRDSVADADQQLFDAIIELPDDLGRFERLTYDLLKADLLIEKAEISEAAELTDDLYLLCAKIDPPLAVLSTILNTKGKLALLSGEADLAERLYEDSLKIARGSGSPPMVASALSGLARAEASLSDYDEAARLVGEALVIVRKIGELKVFEHGLLLQEADLLIHQGQDAERVFGRISDLLTTGYRFDSSPLNFHATVSLGLLAWHGLDDRDSACSYLQEATDIADGAGLILKELLAKGLLGSLLHELGEDKEAEDLMIEVVKRMDQLDLDLPMADSFRELYRYLTGFSF